MKNRDILGFTNPNSSNQEDRLFSFSNLNINLLIYF